MGEPVLGVCTVLVWNHPYGGRLRLTDSPAEWESDGNPGHRNQVTTCPPVTTCYGSGWKKDAVNLAVLRKQTPRSVVDHSRIFFLFFLLPWPCFSSTETVWLKFSRDGGRPYSGAG